MPFPTQYQRDSNDTLDPTRPFSGQRQGPDYTLDILKAVNDGQFPNMKANPSATPGDADFNWHQPMPEFGYGVNDKLNAAKDTLRATDPTSQRLADQEIQARQDTLPSPEDAFGSEIGRTMGRASLAALHAPLGALHPLDSLSALGNATSEAVHHPEEIGPAFSSGVQDPDVMGGALGSAVLMATGDPLAEAGRGTVGLVGRGTSAVGRGAEAAGTAMADSKLGGFGLPGLGVAEAILRADPKGLIAAAAPYALKYGGQGLQKVGGALGALKDISLPNPTLHVPDSLKAFLSDESGAGPGLSGGPVGPEAMAGPQVARQFGPSPHQYETAPSGQSENFQVAEPHTVAQQRAARYATRDNRAPVRMTQSGGDTGSFKAAQPPRPPEAVDLTDQLNALRSMAKMPQAPPPTARSKWFGK